SPMVMRWMAGWMNYSCSNIKHCVWFRIHDGLILMTPPGCVFSLPAIQVALYTRQRLNIRITANFLLALAASLDETKSHVRRYFCAAVQLPSDWLEVVRIYTACFKRSLPSCLKKAMVDKFKQFSEYQLAKYNTRKHRCKHNRNKLKGKVQRPIMWSFLEQNTGKVEKKQSEFSLKKLIKRLHIKEPAEYVMAILGRKYPSDQRAFSRSGLKGEWDPDKAGQRMKLQEPQTWERLVSREGNKAATWEKLIDNKSLPFMAMLRNLRNMITAGISEQHHNKILKRFLRSLHMSTRREKVFTVALLDRYRKALETAVQISCRYNLPPLPGRTVILLYARVNSFLSWLKKQDFCLPPDPEQKDKKDDEDDNDDRRKNVEKTEKLGPSVSDCKHHQESVVHIWEVEMFFAGQKWIEFDCVTRFVSERGSSRLLEHVEHLDRLHNIKPAEGAKGCVTWAHLLVSRWKGVRVFISSTFRDMHSERDVLVQSVFPELRRRAAPHCLYLQEVELRWGVTEEESERATELCLSEVCRNQILVGILGERYGQVPDRPALPDLPQYIIAVTVQYITRTDIERSILYLFCFARSVPVAWRSHFTPESNDAEQKMTTLKNALRDSNVKVTENYSCEWGGVVDGKPHLTKLDEFGKAVLEDLWTAVKKLFVDVSHSEHVLMRILQNNQKSYHLAFFLFYSSFCLKYWQTVQLQTKGHMMVVEGGAGEGKTLFMFSLFRLRDLLAEFHSTLTTMTMTTPLVLLIDGVDLIRDGRGQLSCDWLPPKLPKGVCLVVSMTSKAPLLQTLVKKTGTVLFSLGPLTVPDRREIVKKELDAFGKKLSDSAFNSQLQTLIMKKGALSPLYLHLACEDLRNFASFDRQLRVVVSSLRPSGQTGEWLTSDVLGVDGGHGRVSECGVVRPGKMLGAGLCGL
uniref:TROVE domain-containing protein n=1 Tax=Salarias fasciatus TaxID=181472 RepID=A0A672I8Q6_SALFA